MATSKKPHPAATGVGSRGQVKRPGPPELDDFDGPEHRQFPRARMTVPFRLWIEEAGELRFEATLRSGNVSVAGVFLDSTFFLPVGTEVRTSFVLLEDEPPVQARGQIVRIETPGRDGSGRSGFAVRFLEFFAQTEVTLARLFLGAALQQFAQDYLGSARARSLPNELDRCVDALAAWELRKATSSENPWGIARQPVNRA